MSSSLDISMSSTFQVLALNMKTGEPLPPGSYEVAMDGERLQIVFAIHPDRLADAAVSIQADATVISGLPNVPSDLTLPSNQAEQFVTDED